MKTYKLLSLILCAVISLGSFLGCGKKDAEQTPFEINRGINVSHWLSQYVSDKHPPQDEFFKQEDVAFIKKSGFDHIRLPVDEIELWDEDGKRIPIAFERLANFIGWAMAEDLKIIVDLHTIRSHHFNAAFDGKENTLFTSEKSQETFLKLWTDLSDFLIQYPIESVAYEPLNEVVADTPEQWNELLAKVLAHIREREPNRVIIVGSNRWQQCKTMPDLVVPENDPNLILSFHFYSPFLVTHYKAPWTPLKDYNGSAQYPGIPYTDELPADANATLKKFVSDGNKAYTKESMAIEMAPVFAKAKETGLRVYCGEYGCLKTVDREMLLQWHRDFCDTLAEHGIAAALWDYQGDFGIRNKTDNTIDNDLIKIVSN